MQPKILEGYAREADRTQVLVFAGGKAKRMGSEEPKALINVGGQLLIDRCISYLANCGFVEYVFLLGHGSDEIRNHIRDGAQYGIKATFSEDPVGPSIGKGKSLKLAIEKGRLDVGKRSIVMFPDDIFVDQSMPMRILLEHVYGVKTYGTIASVVLTRGRKWSYGVAESDESGLVKKFEEKPFISLPTSVGIYLFEPAVYSLARDMIELDSKSPVEFETTLLPELARRRQVYGIIIPNESWLPINTQKDKEEAENMLSKLERTSPHKEPQNYSSTPISQQR